MFRYLSGSVAIVVALTGCTSIPTSGPVIKSKPVDISASRNIVDHVLVDVTSQVARRVKGPSLGRENLGGFKVLGGAPDIPLGIGDIVGITIFEASAGGLFIPDEAGSRSGNFVTLPDQTVDNKGMISVPYAGAIRAAGRSAPSVQKEIVDALKNRAIEPQVIVTVKEQFSAQVSVLGEVNAPAKFSINMQGDRVLDVIARAGGPKGFGYESFVTLQRGKAKRTVYFNKLVNDPSNNVFVRPGDTVYVFTQNRSFVVIGATGFNGKFNFEAEETPASEALGRAGGLLDTQANPAAVYIYRQEQRQVLADLGVDVSKWPDGLVPVIYRFNLRKEEGLFTLRQFLVEDKDIIYVENASSVNFLKALTVMRGTVATVNEANIAQYNLRNLNK